MSIIKRKRIKRVERANKEMVMKIYSKIRKEMRTWGRSERHWKGAESIIGPYEIKDLLNLMVRV